MRVICAGHVNWDVTLEVDRLPEPDGEARISTQRQSGGGSASNVAVALSGLDADPLVFGSIGRDEHGWLARRALNRAGVETALVETDGATAVKYIVVEESGELFVLGNDGANEAFAPADLPPERLGTADHLHLTSQTPETAAAMAREAAKAGVPVSFDPGRRLADRDYSETVRRSDLLFCNDREAGLLADSGLDEGVSTLVIKQGSGGATAVTDEREVSHPGFAVDPVDTTGAGDAFTAGFLAARDEGIDRALAVGNACGALAARTPGARVSVGWRDVEALLDIGPSEG
jgi:ribokinase